MRGKRVLIYLSKRVRFLVVSGDNVKVAVGNQAPVSFDDNSPITQKE